MQIRCGYIGNLDFRFFLFVTLISPWILASSSPQKFEFWLQNFRFISEFVSFQSFRKLKYPFKTSFETISTVELSCGVLKSRVCNVTKSIVDQLSEVKQTVSQQHGKGRGLQIELYFLALQFRYLKRQGV